MPTITKPGFALAILPLLTMIIMAFFSTTQWKIGMLVPIITGIAVAAIIGRCLGHTWRDMEASLAHGVTQALPAVFILVLIGMIIGTWISGGIIPTLIYYGLSIIDPHFFLPLACVVTAFVSLVLGSSFTSIATIGLAFMAIGGGIGMPLPIVAGAVISGAFFGDKLSPLSDTTNVAPAIVGEGLFDHIRHMLWDTVPALLISTLLYWIIGLTVMSDSSVDPSGRDALLSGLKEQFVISPLLLIVVLLAILLIALRIPAIPALFGIAIMGGLVAFFVQGRAPAAILRAMTSGYVSETGEKSVDALLSNGGINSMLDTVCLVIIATALGGILEHTGIFAALIDPLVRRIRRPGSLIASTILATFLVGFSSGAQFLAIILPARGFLDAYKRMGLSPLNLSRAVEAAGTVGINLVPWGVPAIFAASIFGLQPTQFIPWILFAFIVPLLNVVYGYAGIGVKPHGSQVKEARDTARRTGRSPSL
ncbi:Na+/H+ antiporter NhaC [Kocuria rhizophila]|uniref:Na+/H+ antiporter NhaC n=1 Tax=Kocuria rhizophila TaxID=72000 RepID=UPI0021A75EA4|nr:Na+/H+ antiporter NhaC [Kocuria rhizophila]MCT2171175.1 Na+/H+ antiporter NhaC [Kocuria rhizophila]